MLVSYTVSSTPEGFVCVSDSLGHSLVSADPDTLLHFLIFSPTSTLPASTLRVIWNLDQSLSPILNLLPDSVRQSLFHADRATWGAYRLFRSESKRFSVSKSHEEANFYHLSQFFPGDSEPDTIDLLQSYADRLLSALSSIGIPSPTTLASPVALAGPLLASWGIREALPSISDAPTDSWGAYDYAFRCTPREWIMNYQIGSWGAGEMFSYDLSSAYASVAATLPDLRDCTFTYTESKLEAARLLRSSQYGFLRGRLYIDPKHSYAFCSPVIVDRGDGYSTNPVGNLPEDYYPIDQLRYILDSGMGTFGFKDGWFISPADGVHPCLPLSGLFPFLHLQRSLHPDASYILKRIMTGIVGKFITTYRDQDGNIRKYDDLYNPVYHAIVTSAVKVKVAQFIVQHGITPSELVHVGVDGIHTTKSVSLPAKASKMGQWVCKGSQPAIILSPGVVIDPDHRPSGKDYHILSALLRAMPNTKRYKFGGWEVDLTSLQSKQTRVYPKLPRNGRGLLENRYTSESVVL